MKVLLAVTNIFSTIGGGQRFFSNLILANPELDFYYFSSCDADDAVLPGNAFPLPLVDVYRRNEACFNGDGALAEQIANLKGKGYDIHFLLDMAASVSSMSFDVLDIPDYLPFGALLQACMRYHHVHIGKVSLSMHGTLSMGLMDNWDPHIQGLEPVIEYEQLLYRSADVRYGISTRYVAQWGQQCGLPAQVVHPQVGQGRSARAEPLAGSAAPPDLCFVGRQEKWKGPDIFLEICSSMPPEVCGDICLVGPSVTIHGYQSELELDKLALHRSLTVKRHIVAPAMMDEWLASSRMVVFAPSRRDTFNLVVLEALLAGCPAVVSTACGVCDYLDAIYPGLPFVRLDPDNVMGSYDAIIDLLTNYERHREALHQYLAGHATATAGRVSIASIYGADGEHDAAARAQVEAAFGHYQSVLRTGINTIRGELSRTAAARFQVFFTGEVGIPSGGQFATQEFLAACRVDETAQQFLQAGNANTALRAVESALPLFADIVHGGNRVNVYRLLAQWELRRGNDLLYATYQLRVARLTGRFVASEVQTVAEILECHNFSEEAKVVRLMAAGDAGSVCEYLRARAVQDFRALPVKFSARADYRGRAPVTVSIIVSVYKGADKIEAFVATLERLTARTKAMTEVVFVDSNSPDDTANVLPERLRLARQAGLHALYVRTPERETIQKAWNRGIDLARGRYLAFLGLDEKVRPDAFELMADYLDAHGDIDWVQGSANVTEVNANGSYLRDVMCYNRSFEMQEMHYLECCYISYVGALYRKSIHERFGYYDTQFRGAGDTEFKNRILPFIRVVSLPETLGTFLNYPEERTTQSPMAELEDLRAWYVFRTVGGLAYGLGSRAPSVAVQLFKCALDYKKSYMDRVCTDVEFASELLDYVRQYLPAQFEGLEQFTPGLASLQLAYRRFDELAVAPGKEGLEKLYTFSGALERVWFGIETAQKSHKFFALPANYWITNDNRWHQHHLLWPSQPQTVFADAPLGAEDLAGCRDLSDVLSACQSDADQVDLARAWRSGKTGQLLRLQELAGLDIVVMGSGTAGYSAQLVAELDQLAAQTGLSVVLLDADVNAVGSASPRLYASGRLRAPRPVLAAAKLLLFPWQGAAAAGATTALLNAICLAKPVVLSAAVRTELDKRCPDIDFSALPVARDADELARLCSALAGGMALRAALRATVLELASQLIGRGHVAPAWPGQAFDRAAAEVEWPPTRRAPDRAPGASGARSLEALLQCDLTQRGAPEGRFSAAAVQQLFDQIGQLNASKKPLDASWQYLYEPLPVTPSNSDLALQRVMAMVWQIRPDLQQLFPLRQPADCCDFILWCLFRGRREYLALAGCFTEELARELEQPEVGLLPECAWDGVMPRLLFLCRSQRPDLVAAFDLDSAASRMAYLFWYLKSGRSEMQLDKFPLPARLQQLLTAPDSAGAANGEQLTGMMALEYQVRPDLQQEFNLAAPGGFDAYRQWYRQHGTRFGKPNHHSGASGV